MIGRQSSNMRHTGLLLAALHAPADELTALLADANPAMRVSGQLVATLSESTAKAFVHQLRDRDGYATTEQPPQSASGSVTIWVKDGEIVKYEVRIDANVDSYTQRNVAGREHLVKFVKLTELSKFDQTMISIPAEAQPKLFATD